MKRLGVSMEPEEHKRAKILAAQYEISIADVIRFALADEQVWRAASAAKAAAKGKPAPEALEIIGAAVGPSAGRGTAGKG